MKLHPALVLLTMLPVLASSQGIIGSLSVSNSTSPPPPDPGFESHTVHRPDAKHSWHVLVLYQDGAVRLTIGLTKKEADRITAKMDAKWWPCGKATTCTRVTMPGDITGVDEFQ